MSRKTAYYTATDGRDAGKIFVLTEMPASRVEAWAMRALMALAKSGVEMPDGYESMGASGLAALGLKALSGLSWDVAQPLIDEMFTCVRIQPDSGKAHVVRELIESDIEEVVTRVKLRAEVWRLHTDFLSAQGE